MGRDEQVVGVILARMRSSRLPGKALADLAGRSILSWVICRSRRAATLDRVVLATTTSAADDAIALACKSLGVETFRGSEADVLGRTAWVAEQCEADWVVRINADCPLIDPACIDQLVVEAKRAGADYAGFCTRAGTPAVLTPIGVFAEVMSGSALARANRSVADPFEREHVTLGIYSRPNEFGLTFVPIPPDLEAPDLRLTLDTLADLDNLRYLVAALGTSALEAGASDYVHALSLAPECLEIMRQQNTLNPKRS